MTNFGQANIRRELGYRLQNSRGSFVIEGGSKGHGGDTAMLPSELFYCGQFRQECRCYGCDGFCGPTSGCPCNACVELVNLRVNKSGYLCRKGTIGNVPVIGQKNIKATDLFYCGVMKNQCYCGCCDGMCGPNGGCPCFDCLELVDMKVNQLGHFCKRGPVNVIAFHLNRPSSELFYCGNNKIEFACGICVGICDPTNGCPCNHCYTLSKSKYNRLGDICHQGTYMTIVAGHTGMPCKDLFYCNKPKNQCHCGNCDKNCGPNNGCPCFDCLELLGLSVLPKTHTIRICKRKTSVNAWQECPCDVCKNYDHQTRNSRGDIAVKGDVGGSGGDTNIESKNLYYCGVVRYECRCGQCNGRCGPTNG